MLLRLAVVLALALAWSGDALAQKDAVAQKKVRTESIKPPAGPPEIITDIARLPPLVASTRERILEAARSGDLQKLVTVMKSNETLPTFSPNDEKDPIAYWKANYPDSDGIEVLAILIEILENGLRPCRPRHAAGNVPVALFRAHAARHAHAGTEGRIAQDCNRFRLQGYG